MIPPGLRPCGIGTLLDPLLVAEHPSPLGDPKGSWRICLFLYIGLRHFVPRPMPMERASFGCRNTIHFMASIYSALSDLSDNVARPMRSTPVGVHPRLSVIG